MIVEDLIAELEKYRGKGLEVAWAKTDDVGVKLKDIFEDNHGQKILWLANLNNPRPIPSHPMDACVNMDCEWHHAKWVLEPCEHCGFAYGGHRATDKQCPDKVDDRGWAHGWKETTFKLRGINAKT